RRLGAEANTETIQLLMENLSSVGRVLHDALNKQVYLETVILKAMRDAHSAKIADLIARLNHLRKAGELEFLDKIPQNTTAPKKTVVDREPQPPALLQVKDPGKKPETENPAEAGDEPELGFDPPPEAEGAKDEFTPNSLWQQVINVIKSGNFVDPTIVHYMNEGNPESFEHSLLTVAFYDEFDSEHYAAIKNIMPAIHQAIQELTGDWAAAVDLIHKKGVRSIHRSGQEVSPPETDEPSPVDEEKESGADAPADSAADNGTQIRSVISDKAILEDIKKKEIVSASLDLFGGTIVDIHG
ncbi:MAG: hypothetical protein PHV59_06115, partial [Victivallales bacterium]|nr:hypothetical protein [Victivallales bacterium]